MGFVTSDDVAALGQGAATTGVKQKYAPPGAPHMTYPSLPAAPGHKIVRVIVIHRTRQPDSRDLWGYQVVPLSDPRPAVSRPVASVVQKPGAMPSGYSAGMRHDIKKGLFYAGLVTGGLALWWIIGSRPSK